ncbi:MAG: hypothetical protein OHK0023_04720 [Anaerolineae bacterium]
MPRTTIKDRMRKNRIREREWRLKQQYMLAIDKLTEEEFKRVMDTLIKINEKAENGAPQAANQVANAAQLLSLGLVRQTEGKLIPTEIGRQALMQTLEE